MKLKIAYWVLTGLFGVMMLASGGMYLSGAPQPVEGFRHLGYPDYFRTLLGIAKLLGAVALLVPVVPRTLREWAYAGFAITLVSASVSHYASGDPTGQVVTPLVILGVLLTSHQLWHRVSQGAAEPQAAARPAMG
ncbi:MAG TPA: DoxX family protein [Archangium sp.]|uniref:DoxX family protein n=1 Tax=Archangium sp. TaxID=1872627 RepID=UPI002E2F78D7|nr:DoxX family protein [Archangium sp.]HEX5747738.1 DoxX family protein [Archangium sp.]